MQWEDLGESLGGAKTALRRVDAEGFAEEALGLKEAKSFLKTDDLRNSNSASLRRASEAEAGFNNRLVDVKESRICCCCNCF